MSFQPDFRCAAKAIMLATHRVAIPSEVGHKIIAFMNRDWWFDERMMCWNQICPKSYDPGNHSRRYSNDFLRCPKCGIATYCCQDCLKQDWKERHKNYCNVPPCRVPTYEEEMLIREVAATSSTTTEGDTTSHPPPKETEAVSAAALEGEGVAAKDDDHDDDEADWEDIDTDDEEEEEGDGIGGGADNKPSKTRTVYKFFLNKAYRV